MKLSTFNRGVATAGMLVVLSWSQMGCSRATWQNVAQGAAQGLSSVGTTSGQKLMLFGGTGHKTYLGCLNCPEYAPDSVFNEFGRYGNHFSTTSIFNAFSQFGSAFSQFGACNRYASDPPVIVDQAGKFYGRLTLNRYHDQATRNRQLREWLEKVVCE